MASFNPLNHSPNCSKCGASWTARCQECIEADGCELCKAATEPEDFELIFVPHLLIVCKACATKIKSQQPTNNLIF